MPPYRVPCAALLAAGLALPLGAQEIAPRSADYLFVTTTDDARAVWVNPAGLAVLTEASVMAEFTLDRGIDNTFAVEQWSAGFNSRGLSFGYQRDRHAVLSSADVLRLGVGLGFEGGALGGAFSVYRGDEQTQRGLDLGIRYRPAPQIDIGAVVRHIGRPRIRGVPLPVTTIAGASWVPVRTHLQLAVEAHAVERLRRDTSGYDLSGYDPRYRWGGRLSTRGRLPLGLVAAVDLGSNFRIDRWTLGLGIGGHDQVVALGSLVPLVGGTQLETLSVTGVASRRLGGRRF